MKLDPIDVANLDVPVGWPDLRRDIHIFVDYVCSHDMKRSHRQNTLSKGDAKRLAKLMTDPTALEEIEEEDGSSTWLDFVDEFALRLGFVHYDTEGEYAGYTSREPSFPDNYIKFVEAPYQKFLSLGSAKQESMLLKLLLSMHPGDASEFYSAPILGRLDRFSPWGSATGVVPLLDFAAARRFLLELLANCPAGQWLSTASLVAYLKHNHRYFLIPQKPKFKSSWEAGKGRYGNFQEGEKRYGHDTPIPESAADAFERVEGRYVERFLEGIPLLLGYVDVAYSKTFPRNVFPSLGCLRGFRLSSRLGPALQGKLPEPKVTITPSFDIYVQAETYPASVLSELAPICELVSEDASIILKITKPKVAAARAANPQLDVVGLLRRLAGAEIPSNVAVELSAWSEHGEKFILYSDCCLLEAERDLPVAARFTRQVVAPGILLIHSPAKLFQELEQQELVPLRVKHGERDFSALPKNARTCFPTKAAAAEKPPQAAQQITLTRVTRVQLACPDRSFLERLHRALIDRKCPVEVDRAKLILVYSKACEAEVSSAIRSLKNEYRIKIEDTG